MLSITFFVIVNLWWGKHLKSNHWYIYGFWPCSVLCQPVFILFLINAGGIFDRSFRDIYSQELLLRRKNRNNNEEKFLDLDIKIIKSAFMLLFMSVKNTWYEILFDGYIFEGIFDGNTKFFFGKWWLIKDARWITFKMDY